MREEGSPWDVLIEQADGCGVHVVECTLLVMHSLYHF
jgi:hypothetical protein